MDPYAASKRAAKAVAEAKGHRMGRWDGYGACECEHCGAMLIDMDAATFVAGCSFLILGSLSAPCPG